MKKHKFNLQTNLSDINLYQCGSETCAANHTQGPAVRPYYLLHFVVDGQGIFQTNTQTYELTAGSAFLITPNQVSLYRADQNNPWEYLWVAFDGIKADRYLKLAGLSRQNPVYRAERPNEVQDALWNLVREAETSAPSETRLMGYMYLFLSTLADNCREKPRVVTNPKDAYIQKSIQYIDLNSWRKITVDELARHIGLNRSYLCAIFKEKLNLSPQDYMIKFRIDRSCELLAGTDMLVADVARLVGYTDQLSFTRIFKQRMGLSPTQYRALHTTPP